MRSSVFFLVLASAFLVPVSCRNSGEQVSEPVSVTVQKISYSQEARPRMFIGKIEAGKTSVLRVPYPGRILELRARKGQRVKGGEILAVIDSPAARSMYETSKATYEQAKDGLDRVNRVYATGSISEQKYVEIKSSYAKAEAAYNAAKRALDDCNLKAPYDGVVGDAFLEEGVDVGVSEPIFRILDTRKLEVHASIPENEYSSFELGQKVEVQVEAAGCTVPATLTNKGIEASSLSHSYDFTFTFLKYNWNMLPGMVCKVYMTPASYTENSVVVPSSSVRVDADGRYVWCIGSDGAVEKKHINVGGFASDGVVVDGGLEEGDLLVVEGGAKISTGMTNIRINGSR